MQPDLRYKKSRLNSQRTDYLEFVRKDGHKEIRLKYPLCKSGTKP